jgi:hypothetical protein
LRMRMAKQSPFGPVVELSPLADRARRCELRAEA